MWQAERILFCTGDTARRRVTDNGLQPIRRQNTMPCKKRNKQTQKSKIAQKKFVKQWGRERWTTLQRGTTVLEIWDWQKWSKIVEIQLVMVEGKESVCCTGWGFQILHTPNPRKPVSKHVNFRKKFKRPKIDLKLSTKKHKVLWLNQERQTTTKKVKMTRKRPKPNTKRQKKEKKMQISPKSDWKESEKRCHWV